MRKPNRAEIVEIIRASFWQWIEVFLRFHRCVCRLCNFFLPLALAFRRRRLSLDGQKPNTFSDIDFCFAFCNKHFFRRLFVLFANFVAEIIFSRLFLSCCWFSRDFNFSVLCIFKNIPKNISVLLPAVELKIIAKSSQISRGISRLSLGGEDLVRWRKARFSCWMALRLTQFTTNPFLAVQQQPASASAREMQKLCIDGAINLIEDFARGARLSMFLDCMWKHIFFAMIFACLIRVNSRTVSGCLAQFSNVMLSCCETGLRVSMTDKAKFQSEIVVAGAFPALTLTTVRSTKRYTRSN